MEIESFDVPPVRRIVLNSGAPIKDGNGRIVGAVVAQMDITDRVKAEEALRHADRRKDEFLAMLAHEVRNPLAPVSAAADLLAMGGLSEPQVKQTSAIISRQVGHIVGLVDDLLDVSRVTRGLVTLSKMRLDAKRIVIAAQSETAEAMLVAVTGYGQEQDRSAAIAAGFDHHFVKPVDTARLAALLSGVAKS
jgi:signal transduction histidine kinase